MKKLSQSGIDALSSKQVKTYAKVLINAVEVKPQSYSYSYNKAFGAATARIRLPNQDGKYSPKGSNPVKWNDPVVIEEGLYNKNGIKESWKKFDGLVRQTTPRMAKGIAEIEVTALDRIVRLEDLDLYEFFYEANKTEVGGYAGVKLKPYPNAEGYSQIYDFVDADYDDGGAHVTDIAPNPIPRIRVRIISANLFDPKWEGFEINYQTGQLILNIPLQTKDYEVFAIFSYYKTADGLYVEDLIKSIITSADGYGNYPFADSDIKSNLLAETSVSQDVMTPNYTTETIDGTDYPAGQVWYLTYNNLITNLVAGDFTIPGGASFASFNKRYGRLILDTPISVNSTVTCDKNYEFWTIQATGIQTPYLSFPSREIPNRFEALNQMRKLLAPNYIFQTRGSNKIWGRYVNQKIKEDYELALKEAVNYAPDTDVYTRVKLFGENASPTNLMRSVGTPVWGYEYITQATDQQLLLAKQEPTKADRYIFEIINQSQLKMARILNNPNPPSISINDVPLNMGRVYLGGQDPNDSPWVDFIEEVRKEYTHNVIVGLSFTGILDIGTAGSKVTVHFEYWDDYVIYPTDQYLKWSDKENKYLWKPPFGHTQLSAISSADFYIRSSNDFGITDDHKSFWIKKRAIPKGEQRTDILKEQPVSFSPGTWVKAPKLTDGKYEAFGDWFRDYHVAFWKEIMVPFPDWFVIDRISWVGGGSHTNVQSEIRGRQLEIQLYIPGGTWKTVYRKIGSDCGRLLGRTTTYKRYDYPGWPGSSYRTLKKGVTEHISITPEYANAVKIRIMAGWSNWYYRMDIRAAELEVRGFVLEDKIKATFWYSANATMPDNIENLHDGLYATQVQSVYPYKPLRGAIWATFDLGSEKNAQAIDLIAGFYIPDKNVPQNKYNVQMNLTLEYALNAPSLGEATFYEISKEVTGFDLSSGDKASFEPDELGENFKMRWLRIKIEDVESIEIVEGSPEWVVALTELAVYGDIVISSECQLTNDPGKEVANDYVNDTIIYYYDSKDLLSSIGDRLYKKKEIDKILNTQEKLNLRAYNLLREFYKEHTKCSVNTPIGSYLELGQTVKVIDPYSKAFSGQSQNYFLEGVNVSGKRTSLILARYE